MSKAKKYSVVEARKNLSELLDQAENGKRVELTRRGKTVAAIVSIEFLHDLEKLKPSFWNNFQKFKDKSKTKKIDFEESDFVFPRDKSTGRNNKDF